MELGNNTQTKKNYKIATIESEEKENYFELSLEFKKGQVNTPQGAQEQISFRVVDQGWK
jgi:hypothetical protein